jgi:hypothetical protein
MQGNERLQQFIEQIKAMVATVPQRRLPWHIRGFSWEISLKVKPMSPVIQSPFIMKLAAEKRLT